MNYIIGIVKILEVPKQKFLDNNVVTTYVRAQLSHLSHINAPQIVRLTFWGILANEVANCYTAHDYMIIEGYLSFNNKPKLNLNFQISKKVEILVLKIYPFLVTYDHQG